MFADLCLATGLLLLGVLACWQTRRVRQLGRALAQAGTAHSTLEQEMHALLECSRALGQRVRDQQARQHALDTRLQTLTRNIATPGSAATPHDARRLVDEGLDVEQVASLCELSQGEAALLSRWRARRAAA